MNGQLAVGRIRAGDHNRRRIASPPGIKLPPQAKDPFRPLIGLIPWLSLLMMVVGCGDSEEAPARSHPGDRQAATSTSTPTMDAPPDRSIPDWVAEHATLSPNAQIETHLLMIEDKATPRHPGDGGGRAWIERVFALSEAPSTAPDRLEATDASMPSPSPVWTASESGSNRPALEAENFYRFEIGFEVGPDGIDEGGLIFVGPEPFWYWSASQTESPHRAGFTTARASKGDVALVPEGGLGAFGVQGRRLEPGERLHFVYGAGPGGAQVDSYAEDGAQIWVGVDADGDGVRAWLEELPRVDVFARPAQMLVAFGPAQVEPGAPFELTVAVLDARGNRARWPGRTSPGASPSEGGRIRVEVLDQTIEVPVDAGARESRRITLEAPASPTTLRIRLTGIGPLADFETTTHPIRVKAAGSQLLWADLHGHSQLSDGSGSAANYFEYAREVARLDVVSLTDHDHWGLRYLDESPDLHRATLADVTRYNEPGRFLTVPGYEWTSWLHGHRHVLYFDETLEQARDQDWPIHSSIDPATDRPDELWAALRGRPALTFAHHSAGEPVATNWAIAPDPVLEPITEIVSVHGASEAADAPQPVDAGIEGNYVRDQLVRGLRIGFIGSGDSHDGHPGLAQIAAGNGGLAGIHATRFDRAGVLEALRLRRSFATNGIRPWFDVQIDDTLMGGTLPRGNGVRATSTLRIRYEATAPVERIDLIRSGGIVRVSIDGALSLDTEREIASLGPGEFHYVRILESGGGVAWSSPIFGPASAP